MNTLQRPGRYADLTVNDRNPVKRYLQRKRLRDSLFAVTIDGQAVLDLGGGDGELARLLSSSHRPGRVVCYEPMSDLRRQAQANLAALPGVEVIGALDALAHSSFDVIFCLEVLEHLPDRELGEVLDSARLLLRPAGRLVIGVPNEIGIAALLRALFRWSRGVRNFDTDPRHVLQAVLGRPPRNREAVDLDDGRRYYRRHMGFDYRQLEARLGGHFRILRRYGSPCRWLPVWLNFEAYFVCTHGDGR